MKRVNSIGVTAILVSTLIMGCDTNLDMSSIQHTPKLVVNSFVNSDELFSVQVSSTIPINDTNPPKMIENAIVTVNDGSTTATLVYDLSVQKYLATFKPYPGKVYSVRVEKGNFNTASGTLTIPNKVVSAKSIWKDKTGLDSSGFETGTLTCFIADASAERNYYEINLYRFDDITQEWLILPPTTIDPFLNENGIKTDIGGILIDDRSFNGSKNNLILLPAIEAPALNINSWWKFDHSAMITIDTYSHWPVTRPKVAFSLILHPFIAILPTEGVFVPELPSKKTPFNKQLKNHPASVFDRKEN